MLTATAAGQNGVFSRAQAYGLGVDRRVLLRAIDSGLIVRVGMRSFRFAGAELTWRGQLRAGLLDLGPAALVAGASAAALLGLDGYGEGWPEFLVPRAARDRRTVGAVRSGPPVAPIDRTVVDGFPVTGAALTIIHVAGRSTRRELANALDSAVRLRLVSPAFLAQRLAAVRYQGLPGVEMLDDVLRDAGVESWLERRFLELLRAARLPAPSLQRIVSRDGRQIARVDFDFGAVVVEVGGQKGYLTRTERQRQERRRSELQLLGKVVYFFAYEDVTEEPDYVVATLRRALARAA
jgi:hypothetical protein